MTIFHRFFTACFRRVDLPGSVSKWWEPKDAGGLKNDAMFADLGLGRKVIFQEKYG
jgi:hypothetical protein